VSQENLNANCGTSLFCLLCYTISTYTQIVNPVLIMRIFIFQFHVLFVTLSSFNTRETLSLKTYLTGKIIWKMNVVRFRIMA
jgi:hypothetical protein